MKVKENVWWRTWLGALFILTGLAVCFFGNNHRPTVVRIANGLGILCFGVLLLVWHRILPRWVWCVLIFGSLAGVSYGGVYDVFTGRDSWTALWVPIVFLPSAIIYLLQRFKTATREAIKKENQANPMVTGS